MQNETQHQSSIRTIRRSAVRLSRGVRILGRRCSGMNSGARVRSRPITLRKSRRPLMSTGRTVAGKRSFLVGVAGWTTDSRRALVTAEPVQTQVWSSDHNDRGRRTDSSARAGRISPCTEPREWAHQECEWKQGGGCHLFTDAILETLDKDGLLMEEGPPLSRVSSIALVNR